MCTVKCSKTKEVFVQLSALGHYPFLKLKLSKMLQCLQVKKKALISLVMGSKSDFTFMKEAMKPLDEFGVAYETKVVSAHRTPDRLYEYSQNLRERGIKVLIAGAGGAAHLPGMISSMTSIPVLGVPIPATEIMGFDSLLSIVQMPKGIPVGTLAIGKNGAYNAAILALRILSLNDEDIVRKMDEWVADLRDRVPHEPMD